MLEKANAGWPTGGRKRRGAGERAVGVGLGFYVARGTRIA